MKLICPICGKPLIKQERSALCEQRHCFDYAKSGYLNLLRSSGGEHGDNAAMVQARTAFLGTGAYAFLRETITSVLNEEPVDVFADLGCGEGYYTGMCPGNEKYGFDLSKAAVTKASKTDRTTQYAIASIFHLPLPDSSVDAALTCFAPAAGEELERILKPGGRFVFVQPATRHLYELKDVLYEDPYENDETPPVLPESLHMEKERIITRMFHADNASLMNLFQMTPYAYKTGAEGKARLEEVPSLDITASFVIRVYRRAGSSSIS